MHKEKLTCLKITQICLSSLLILLGLVFIYGWMTHTHEFFTEVLSHRPIVFNSALSFVLTGVGILLRIYKKQKSAMIIASIIGLIAILSIIEYFLGIHLHIDEFFIPNDHLISQVYPRKMGINTSLSFLLTSVLLLLFSTQKNQSHQWISGVLSSCIFGLGLSSFIGHFLEIQDTSNWLNYTRMRMMASIGAMIIGCITFLETVQSANKKTSIIRILTPISLSSLVVVGILIVALNSNQTYKPDEFNIQNLSLLLIGIVIFISALILIISKKAKSFEIELEEKQVHLAIATKAANIGLWDWNFVEDRIYFDDTWCNLLGYKKSELKASFETWKSLIHPDDKIETVKALESHLDGDTEEFSAKYRMKKKDGSWEWIKSDGKVLARNLNEKPMRFAGIQQNITKEMSALETSEILIGSIIFRPFTALFFIY